jgi:hypothetical protein
MVNKPLTMLTEFEARLLWMMTLRQDFALAA